MWRLTSAIMAALLVFSGSAWAGDDKPSFKEADVDGDGKISIEEAEQAGISKEMAKAADLDDDGKLTKGDWRFLTKQSSQTS